MNVDNYPKSIRKAVRYIKQGATRKGLEEIRKPLITSRREQPV
ncbi:hypothetical protein [Mesobacillus foraminis]|nr:hypothetical protein [Mesobacillus foraminis]